MIQDIGRAWVTQDQGDQIGRFIGLWASFGNK